MLSDPKQAAWGLGSTERGPRGSDASRKCTDSLLAALGEEGCNDKEGCNDEHGAEA